MKENVYKVVKGICLIALGFIIAILSMNWTENIKDKNGASSPVVRNEEVMQNNHLNWINEGGIVGTRLKNGDSSTYSTNIFLPFIQKTIKMDISELEYRVLQDHDAVKVHYIYEEDKILFVQFVRDEKGRLQIIDNRPVVVLDAGHGGFDDGEGTSTYDLEKDNTLKITMKQKELLEESGIRVILTRDEDEFVSLYERSSISNYVDADLFISNHINKYDGETKGIEVIYNLDGDEVFANTLAEGLSAQGLPIHKVFSKQDDRLTTLDYYFLHEYNDSNTYIIEYGFADVEQDAQLIDSNWEGMAASVCDTIKAYLVP